MCYVGSRFGTCSYTAVDGSSIQSSGSTLASSLAAVFRIASLPAFTICGFGRFRRKICDHGFVFVFDEFLSL